jgi:predicted aspartyl protease
MRKIKFPFEKKPSRIFGETYRPIAAVDFWSEKIKDWVKILAIVDTGADYTLLPRFYANDLGINLEKGGKKFITAGVGGSEKVCLAEKVRVKLGDWLGNVPVGFLGRDNIPPLLGRQGFLNLFKIVLFKHITYFSNPQS